MSYQIFLIASACNPSSLYMFFPIPLIFIVQHYARQKSVDSSDSHFLAMAANILRCPLTFFEVRRNLPIYEKLLASRVVSVVVISIYTTCIY